MAGIVLSQQKLAEMNDANFRAMKTAKGQLKEALALNADLRAAVSALSKENGDLTRERDALRDNVICSFCGSTYPVGQEPPEHWMTCKESPLLNLLERTQAQRDAAQAELNRVLPVVNAARRLVDNYDKDCGVCRQQFLKELIAVLATFDAARGVK